MSDTTPRSSQPQPPAVDTTVPHSARVWNCSYLRLADGADTDEAGNEAQRRCNERSPLPYHLRSPERITAFSAGLDLVDPGVVPCSRWRPERGCGPAEDVATLGGVARKP